MRILSRKKKFDMPNRVAVDMEVFFFWGEK